MPCTCRPRTVVLDGLLDEHGALFEYPGHVSGVRSVFCDREWRGSLVAIDNRVRSALIAPMRFGASTRSNCLYHRQTKRPFERSQVPLETLDEFNPFDSIYLRLKATNKIYNLLIRSFLFIFVNIFKKY